MLAPSPTHTETESDAAPLELPPGTVLAGDFRIDRRIGVGGMGVVYRGWQLSADRPVAVKTLGTVAPTGVQRQRFIREARAVGGVCHPGVVELYHIGHDRGLVFLAMELIDGRTVRDWLSGAVAAETVELRPAAEVFWRPGADDLSFLSVPAADPARLHNRWHVRRATEVVRDAARAVAAAHRCGVVHRDLKPDNLMLDADGRVRVIDFGLSRAYADATLTATGNLIGTPLYMAPEQLSGRPAGPASDVYALGVVLYELLAGRCPAAGGSYEAVLRNVLYRPPVPIDRLNPAVDRWLAAAVHAALARDPADRYPTADALADDLDRWLADRAVTATGYRYRFDNREVLAERPRLVTAAGYVCLVTAGFFLFVAGLMPLTPGATPLKVLYFVLPGLGSLVAGLAVLSGRRAGWWAGMGWAAVCVLEAGLTLYMSWHPLGVVLAGGYGLAGVWVLTRRRVRDWFRFAADRRAEFRAARNEPAPPG